MRECAQERYASRELVDKEHIVGWCAGSEQVSGEVELSCMGKDYVQLALDSTGERWDNMVYAEGPCRRTVPALAHS